jgi:hypothetical protein
VPLRKLQSRYVSFCRRVQRLATLFMNDDTLEGNVSPSAMMMIMTCKVLGKAKPNRNWNHPIFDDSAN